MHNRTQFLAAFGFILSGIRRSRKLTQEAVAEAAGLERAYISRLERGKASPTLTTLWRLSATLDCPVSEMMQRLERMAK